MARSCCWWIPANQADTSAFYILGTPEDSDGDALTDAFERLVSKTDPANPDSDSDQMPDSWELAHGLNPLDPEDADADPDDDGLTNYEEYVAASNPFDSMLLGWGDGVRGQNMVPWGLGPVAVVASGGASVSLGIEMVNWCPGP